MRDCNHLLVIGPGASTKQFNLDGLDRISSLSFSGSIDWLAKQGKYPTYWTFLDPNSIIALLDNINKGVFSAEWVAGLKENTTIIYNKFQGNDEFYSSGFTTSRGKDWNREVFGGQIIPEAVALFKEAIVLDQVVNNFSFESYYDDSTKVPLAKHVKNGTALNTDKFITFTLPLAITCFTELKVAYCIGFGDFDLPRIAGSSLGYEGYILSYNWMKEETKKLLEYTDTRLEFINKNTYFKELEWKK